ncbi:hypothetical protein PGIGA_G00155630 [Pangasianodon gigas]|uniref:Uncharacterized protein n=1 Tax=Pangasianodon gigas TaxID=30993 RepID=A0ACC5XQ34_PANGG|nr:hypothetical protein [Pangasianodon gigas]
MEEFSSGDEVGFSPDDASNAVKECIEGVIGGVDYSQNKVNQWTASIVEHSLTQLVKQAKAFKYIGNDVFICVGFSPDDASNAVKECIEGVIGGVDYSQNKVNQWTASIVEHSLTQLVKQAKAFKYIGNDVFICCIEGVIGGVDYSQNKVNQWTASIVEHSLTQLVKQAKAFKYIVNCAIMQKSGAGLHTANSCYWDTTTDGSCTVKWENRTMYCVVSVFAVAL